MTIQVPKAIESATSRLGFLTSAAVKPMLFQASAEKSEPTCATPYATIRPITPLAAVTVGTQLRRKFAPGSIGTAPRMAQKCEKFSVIAPAFLPTKIPRRISPTSDKAFALVNTFCISLPRRTPCVFKKVSNTIISTPTSCWTERLIASLDPKAIGGTSHVFGEIVGNNTPRYRANPTATAAIVPVWITRNNVHPYKNPQSGEYASRR